MFYIAILCIEPTLRENEAYYPLKIRININGKWETRICLLPRDIPSGHSFEIIETNVKV